MTHAEDRSAFTVSRIGSLSGISTKANAVVSESSRSLRAHANLLRRSSRTSRIRRLRSSAGVSYRSRRAGRRRGSPGSGRGRWRRVAPARLHPSPAVSRLTVIRFSPRAPLLFGIAATPIARHAARQPRTIDRHDHRAARRRILSYRPNARRRRSFGVASGGTRDVAGRAMVRLGMALAASARPGISLSGAPGVSRVHARTCQDVPCPRIRRYCDSRGLPESDAPATSVASE